MTLLIINFELKEKKRNYKTLFNELYYLGALQLTKETWIIKRHYTHATTFRNHLIQFIYETDSLIVSKIQEFAFYRTKNLPQDLPN